MAESRIFHYETEIEWKGEREGQLTGRGMPDILVGAPPEFKGREGYWTPEHLFVGAVNSCFVLTLLAIAENSRVTLVNLSSKANGILESIEGAGYRITEIVLKPRVVVGSMEELGRITRILEKAKELCFVTNSIKSTVKLEPEVFHRQTETSPCPPGKSSTSGGVDSRPKQG